MVIDDTSRYLGLVREKPRPTKRQMRAFARFLASDHSWYKKLPLRGAGEPFFVFLDPTVHTARIKRADGTFAARDVVEDPKEHGLVRYREYRIALQPGDLEPGFTGPLHYEFSNTGSAEYRERYSYWGYWNWGLPDQPRAEALEQAARGLRVWGEDAAPIPVPEELLDLGLVYLRATISGQLGPTEDEYERLRGTEGLPDAYEDQASQLAELEAAMRRVADRIYG